MDTVNQIQFYLKSINLKKKSKTKTLALVVQRVDISIHCINPQFFCRCVLKFSFSILIVELKGANFKDNKVLVSYIWW